MTMVLLHAVLGISSARILKAIMDLDYRSGKEIR